MFRVVFLHFCPGARRSGGSPVVGWGQVLRVASSSAACFFAGRWRGLRQRTARTCGGGWGPPLLKTAPVCLALYLSYHSACENLKFCSSFPHFLFFTMPKAMKAMKAMKQAKQAAAPAVIKKARKKDLPALFCESRESF